MDKKRFFLFRFSFWVKFVSIFALIGLLLSYLAPFIHPSTFWPIAFFGLAYPFFLAVSILLLIGFVFKLSKWTFVVLICIVAGGKLHFRHFTYNTTNVVRDDGIKLMSYNVRLFDYYDWIGSKEDKTLPKILNHIKTENPDIACFQEFFTQDGSKEFKTNKRIKKIMNNAYLHERYHHKAKGRKNFGVAIFSKYPIIAKGDITFPNNVSNYCIYADIVKGKDTLRIYNVHLQSIRLQTSDFEGFETSSNSDYESRKRATIKIVDKFRYAFPARIEQAQKVINHSKTSPYPVIICGDFNDTPLSYTYNLFNQDYIDAFRESGKGFGWSYAGKLPAGRIDYIFHDENYRSNKFSIQKEKLSDHYSITSRLVKN